MIKSVITVLSIIISFGFTFEHIKRASDVEINDQTNVRDLLISYGETKPAHFIDQVDMGKAKKGEEIVKTGSTTGPDGTKSAVISKYFVCTNCHNTVKEVENPADLNPNDRLQYAKLNKIPYLPGSTFWGIVNRNTWYNGDYVKKYGEKAKDAHESLTKSVQLCATECSCGRLMEDWELEAVLHYFTSLQIKLGDLKLSDSEWTSLRNFKDNADYKENMREMLKSKYVTAYPATFPTIVPVEERKKRCKWKCRQW